MTLAEWAERWGIPPQAFAELAACSIVPSEPDELVGNKSEAYVQSAVRLAAPYKGLYLWRNNVGAGSVSNLRELCDDCRRHARRVIRWGLGNDSKKINDVMKSADLIGIEKKLITADMVGSHIGKFHSIETKSENWRYSGTQEENAQLAWSTLINSLGGSAKIVNSASSL